MSRKSGGKKDSEFKTFMKKAWYFIWEDDSMLSWIVNVILAFVLIKFLVYPGIGLVLGTSHPIVAVVSGSMEHKITTDPLGNLVMCGHRFSEKRSVNFDYFWETCGDWYSPYEITKSDFSEYSFKNGFNTGDIIILTGRESKDLKVGDVIVFQSFKPEPIIHRIIAIHEKEGKLYFETKGDHNPAQGLVDRNISEDAIIGTASFRVPFLGWVKILFVKLLTLVGVI